MVLLAITQKGLIDALGMANITGEPVWCGSGAIADRGQPFEGIAGVSCFAYGLDGEDAQLLPDAIGTIAEHHPGQTIWVESVRD